MRLLVSLKSIIWEFLCVFPLEETSIATDTYIQKAVQYTPSKAGGCLACDSYHVSSW
jgi:hypothetical protein